MEYRGWRTDEMQSLYDISNVKTKDRQSVEKTGDMEYRGWRTDEMQSLSERY